MKNISLLLIFLFAGLGIRSNGQNWTELNSNTTTHLLGCHYINPDIAFFVGENSLILRTEDGGNSFTSTTIAGADDFYDVFFTDVSTGYVVGSAGKIFKTVNGGDSWTPLNSQTSAHLRCVRFFSANVGFVTGWNPSIILRTEDAGATWVIQNIPVGDNQGIFGIDFSSTNTAFAAGYAGRLYKSFDAGANWSYDLLSSEPLLDVHFISPLVGFVIGASGSIRKTTDGGNSWTVVPSGSFTSHFTRIWFADANLGFIIGGDVAENDGTITSTTDGGLTWNTVYTGTSRLFGGYIGGQVGYACGLNGTILKYTRGSSAIDENDETNLVMDVYPNPAQEYTQVVLSETAKGDQLVLFDNVGRIVKKLTLNGTSSVYLPTHELVAGQYTVQVITQKGTLHTQKLIIQH